MKIKSALPILITIILVVCASFTKAQVGITFTLGNSAITTDGISQFYEFDIIAEATANSQFKLAQVYLDYNTAGFGSSIFSSGNVTVTKGNLLADAFEGTFPNFGAGSYTITLNDNSPSKLSIANDFNYSLFGTYTGTGYDLTNSLGTTASTYVRVSIRIQDPSELSGISLDETVSQFELQQFYYTTAGTDDQANYSPVIVGSGLNEPLPVELSSFTSKLINDKVQLNWQTKTEVRNYGFNIERSLKDGEWSTIGFVEGYGNSNSTKFYSFSDKDLFAGGSEFLYRLKQIDTDGKFEYSDVVAVTVIPSKFELAQNYPNPFNPSTTIRFSLPQSAQVKLNVYNLLGQQIATIAEGLFEQGFHKVEFNADNLSSGAYIYRIESSDPSTGSRNGQAGQSFVQVKKMVLIK